jgi:hypothetical protein
VSISVEFADGEGGRTEGTDLATNLGWHEFGNWALELPDGPTAYRSLVVLVEHGYVLDIPALVAALKAALADHPPPASVRGVARAILKLAHANAHIEGMFISDDS